MILGLRRFGYLLMSILLHLALVMTSISCAQESSMVDQHTVPNFRPVWQVGQVWRVEYGVTVPSTKMGPVTHPPPPQQSIWRYEVVVCDEDTVHLALSKEGGRRRYQLYFDRQDTSLRAIFSIEDSEQEEVDEVIQNSVYFGWTPSHPVIFDWPYFPKIVDPKGFQFKTSTEEPAIQTAQSRNGMEVDIAMTCKEDDDAEITTSRQRWTLGEPWWSEASIELKFEDKDKPETVILIHGRRIP